jgi:hypothetical protein
MCLTILHADQKRVEFRLPEQVPTDSVPRGISSGSEKRATEFYPWVPEDDRVVVSNIYNKAAHVVNYL